MWETPGARVGVFAKSKGLAAENGSWQDLTDRTIPEWIAGDFGLEYTTRDAQKNPGPQNDASTKTSFFRLRNMYGGESECRLFSIDNENEIASKVKNKSFSMLYFIELSMFKYPRLLSITSGCLRLPHLKPKPGHPDIWHQWIADTNPDEDLGKKSWFYKEFYENPQKAHIRADNETDEEWDIRKEYYANVKVIEMFLTDNPHASREQIVTLKMQTRDDQGLYDSYVLGIHGDGGQKNTRHFASLFNKNVHVIGGGDAEGDQIDVNKNTTTLHTGWDIGAVSNHAAGIVDIWTNMIDGVERSCFSVLDEEASFSEQIRIDDFAQGLWRKMQAIEKSNNRKYEWIHWSDDTALNVFRPTSGTFDYLEVMKATKGEIVLQGVPKPDGSVRTRVRLLRRLLRENRIFVSARCVHVIAMIEECRRGSTESDFVLWDVHKHTFDWLTYIIFMELLAELQDQDNNPKVGHISEIISV